MSSAAERSDHLERSDEVELVKNSEAGQYELYLDGQRIGLATYQQRGDVVVLPHTETLAAFVGRGFAGTLVAFCLDDIREQGLRVDPACSFVRSYIDKHPKYRDLVTLA